MDGNTPAKTTVGHKVRHLASAVDHLFLQRFDPQSIRVFLRAYDAYRREVVTRASQLTQESSTPLQPVSPVSIIYCVDAEQLQSFIEIGMFEGCTEVEELTDECLRSFLKTEAQESQTTVTETNLAATVQSCLKMDMTVQSAKARMKLLFAEYKSFLRKNGLNWVIEKAPKIAIKHVLSVVKSAQLRMRLEQDIGFSHYHLREDFKGFMQHAFEVSEAFEKIDVGPPKARKSEKDVTKTEQSSSSSESSSSKAGLKGEESKPQMSKKPPPGPCPLPKCKGKDRLHWISDCTEHSDAEKKQNRDDTIAAKARDGPASSTRSKTAAASGDSKSVSRLLKKPERDDDSPSCAMTISDDSASMDVIGRWDDGSDENIANPTVAEKAVLQGIGKIDRTKTVRLKVALKKADQTGEFAFSRSWKVPTTALHLSAGQLDLKNTTFLVADDNVESEDLLIGLPVLEHLRVDTKTLLEENIDALHGTDCSLEVIGQKDRRLIGRTMVSQPTSLIEKTQKTRQAHSLATHRTPPEKEKNHSNPSLHGSVFIGQHYARNSAVDEVLKPVKTTKSAKDQRMKLDKTIDSHVKSFPFSSLSCPQVKSTPRPTELSQDSKPVKVRLQNFKSDLRTLLGVFISTMIIMIITSRSATIKSNTFADALAVGASQVQKFPKLHAGTHPLVFSSLVRQSIQNSKKSSSCVISTK